MALSDAALLEVLPYAPDGLLIFSDEERLVFINERGCHLFGWSSDGALGEGVGQFFRSDLQLLTSPNSRGGIGQHLNLASRQRVETVGALRHDGTEFLGDICVSTRATDEGRLFLVSIREASSVDLALQQLEVKAELFDHFADSAGVGFFLREGDEALYLDPKILTMLGFDPSKPSPTLTEVRTRIHPEDRSKADVQISIADEGSTPAPSEGRIVGYDGKERWFRSISNPYVTPNGTARVASMFVDISDLKLAEAATQRALIETIEANAAKTEFLSRMSHELRTPLNSILGYGQLLDMETNSPEHRDFAKQILRAGRHLLELIDETMDISRMERGEMRLSLEAVSVSDVIRDAVEMLLPLAELHDIRISNDVADLELHVHADRQRLRQVIVNLLANAVKYNRPNGAVRVESDDRDDRLRLSIVDTGIGIADEELHRLFQPFERIGAHDSQIEGTGLGLALTRHLMDAMSGEVGVSSVLGEGSTFWIELPTVTRRDADASTTPTPGTPTRAASSTQMTVLYIEDNLSNVHLLERIMTHRPEVTLLVATSGLVGIDLALDRQPDLILLDLHLPDISGEEVLRSLRSTPRTATTPIVIVSADAAAERQRTLLSAGATDYVTKPFDVARLLTVLDSVRAMHEVEVARHVPQPASTTKSLQAHADAARRSDADQTFHHDINNHFGVVITYAHVLSEGTTDPTLIAGLNAINDSACKALALVDGVRVETK